MVNIIQKEDLSPLDFDNDNSLAAGGVTILPEHKVPPGGANGQVLTSDGIGGRFWQNVAAGGGDLGYTASPTDGTVTNTGGLDATLPLFDDTNAGLMIPHPNDTNEWLRGDGTWQTLPVAGDIVAGVVELAVAANYPDPANDVDATTPAYVDAAINTGKVAVFGNDETTLLGYLLTP